MGFTPGWVLGSTCGMITNKFVIGEISLQAYTNKFSKDLLQKLFVVRIFGTISYLNAASI